MKRNENEKVFVLCPARHSHLQIDGLPSIFPTEISDVTDVGGLTEVARNAVRGAEAVVVYVTGLTVATTAVIRACYTLGIPLTLRHFDRSTGEYFPQPIITPQDAAMMREGGWYA